MRGINYRKTLWQRQMGLSYKGQERAWLFSFMEPEPPRDKLWIHLLLFLVTLVTTLWAGANWKGVDVFADPLQIYQGYPFSFTLLLILGVHEFGHYFFSRRHGVNASLPYFIPSPIPLLGTFGAFIKLRSMIHNRRALLDIGAAGPLAGFVIAIPVTIIGLYLSEVRIVQPDLGGLRIEFGEPLIFSILAWIVMGPIPEGANIYVHSVAIAGWFGFLVTSINLLPIGQLDGGHVIYSLLGNSRLGRRVRRTFFVACLGGLGYLASQWSGWFLWLLICVLFGLRHPPALDDTLSLDGKRKVVALLTLLVFVLSFIPIPLTMTFPE